LYIIAAVVVGSLAGCETKDELEKQNAELQARNIELSRDIAVRDRYIEEMVSSINKVYTDLETARTKEKMLLKETESTERTQRLSSAEVRKQILSRILDIGNVLKENRTRIADLETKLLASPRRFQSLEEMVATLKQTLEEREEVIARLETSVKALTVKLAERESRIREQQRQMNTVFYIVGTRRELEEKGVIRNEGGFLWGLIGSTTILVSGVDDALFRRIDRTTTTTLTVAGEIHEIIPQRSEEFYELQPNDDLSTTVNILDPVSFWQYKYLVIITR
jgi:hypothetical protein